MAGNKIQEGRFLTVIATAAVLSGQGVMVGDLFGVAMGDAAIGEEFEIDTAGVYELPKDTSQDIGQGDKVYWAASGSVTSEAASNTLIGCAAYAAGNGVADISVRLNGTVI
ncbi:DUF2190 family protein [Sansalvadorimonas verongulae]|uniref:DUF2190 family protein n=1 Tax=Sansalvadorimonas verongulae TaxID=2172824 RepID=UPI0012BC73E0|nr:capsid cement protein [Sansalvadorimonas verongulae]MTI13358.1 DUF2190 family protein [Sansalvadorimonas verongulae]